MVGLGGFLSIVSQNGRRLANNPTSLTTGNAFTVAMGLRGLRRAVQEQGLDLSGIRLAAVGATGNICSTYLRIVAEETGKLTLIGRSGSRPRLERVAALLYQDAWSRLCEQPLAELGGLSRAIASSAAVDRLQRLGGPDRPANVGTWLAHELVEEDGDDLIRIEEDLAALGECEAIVTASNASEPLIYPQHLSARTRVICDISVPSDVADEVRLQRPDILVLNGGIAQLPGPAILNLSELRLPPGQVFACMAETVLLGWAGAETSFSVGQISPADVKQIEELGRAHGVELGYLLRRKPM
jgi:predicted amino acid dehydrogenase